MIVLQQINDGLSVILRASSIAARIASGLWPSTSLTTCQPYALKRAGVSSLNQPSTSPSIEMPLSSQNATSLPRPNVPANEQASCEIPSIKQPSPMNAYVKWSTIS